MTSIASKFFAHIIICFPNFNAIEVISDMLVNVLPFNSFINIYIFTSFEADMSVYIIAALWQYRNLS